MNDKLAKRLRSVARAATPGLPERALQYNGRSHRLEQDPMTTRGVYRLLKKQAQKR